MGFSGLAVFLVALSSSQKEVATKKIDLLSPKEFQEKFCGESAEKYYETKSATACSDKFLKSYEDAYQLTDDQWCTIVYPVYYCYPTRTEVACSQLEEAIDSLNQTLEQFQRAIESLEREKRAMITVCRALPFPGRQVCELSAIAYYNFLIQSVRDAMERIQQQINQLREELRQLQEQNQCWS